MLSMKCVAESVEDMAESEEERVQDLSLTPRTARGVQLTPRGELTPRGARAAQRQFAWCCSRPSDSMVRTCLMIFALLGVAWSWLATCKDACVKPVAQERSLAVQVGSWSQTGRYFIENVHAAGQFLNVADTETGSAAAVQLLELPSPTWRIAPASIGAYNIKNLNAAGQYLNVADNERRNGAIIDLRSNPESPSSQWRIAQSPGGAFTFENVNAPGLYLSFVGRQNRSSASVELWDNPESPSTQWYISQTAGELKGSSLSENWSVWQLAEHEVDVLKSWKGWEALAFVQPTTTFTLTSTYTVSSATKVTTTATTTTTNATNTTLTVSVTLTHTGISSTTTTTSSVCMVAKESSDCYREVVGVMHDIRDRSTAGDGILSVWSSFEEVQDHLHESKKGSKCRRSCECETALMGSVCYESVPFARKEGVKEHPAWYPTLDESSTFEEFQTHLWKYFPDGSCSRPCKALWRADLSLFCWSAAARGAPEADVMKAQVEAGAGIFGCDGFAVASESSWRVGKGPGKRIGVVNTVTFHGAGTSVPEDGAARNALLFMSAWNAVIEKTFVLECDWAVKVDPDTVVLADRLRDHLKEFSGQNVFVRNCNSQPASPDSMKALSKEALQTYVDNYEKCEDELDWYEWSDDFFLSVCLPLLGVEPVDDFALISDGMCTNVDCYSSSSAAFHPFESSADWMGCWNAATAGLGGPPPALP